MTFLQAEKPRGLEPSSWLIALQFRVYYQQSTVSFFDRQNWQKSKYHQKQVPDPCFQDSTIHFTDTSHERQGTVTPWRLKHAKRRQNWSTLGPKHRQYTKLLTGTCFLCQSCFPTSSKELFTFLFQGDQALELPEAVGLEMFRVARNGPNDDLLRNASNQYLYIFVSINFCASSGSKEFLRFLDANGVPKEVPKPQLQTPNSAAVFWGCAGWDPFVSLTGFAAFCDRTKLLNLRWRAHPPTAPAFLIQRLATKPNDPASNGSEPNLLPHLKARTSGRSEHTTQATQISSYSFSQFLMYLFVQLVKYSSFPSKLVVQWVT